MRLGMAIDSDIVPNRLEWFQGTLEKKLRSSEVGWPLEKQLWGVGRSWKRVGACKSMLREFSVGKVGEF